MKQETNFKIGKNIETNETIKINLEKLLTTRLLIQANSGGGKSWLLRKILEETNGKVQQIIIDLEGEFSTLREKYDYLLVAKDGDIPISIKTAELLAKKLLELKVSSILDISELKHHERILFVKRFLDSLVNAPKKLWHSCLVVVDEAHQFCPQSSKSESANSVIDLMTRGRKRGFCGILATQRISKLNKDACAEANNRLIGRTGLDIDRKRASEELGFTTKTDNLLLRDLGAGEFFCFGSAISKEIKKVKIGDVKTSHPEIAGEILDKPIETPKNIEKILKSIIDLPKQAEEELKTNEDLQRKVILLKREMGRLKKSQTNPIKTLDEERIRLERQRGFELCKKEMIKENLRLKQEINSINNKTKKVKNLVKLISKELISEDLNILSPNILTKGEGKSTIALQHAHLITTIAKDNKINERFQDDINEEIKLGKAEEKIYSLLLEYPDKTFTKSQIGVFTGYSKKSGSFNNSLYKLKALNLIEKSKDDVTIKQIRTDIVKKDYNFSIKAILCKLGKCEKEIYEILLDNPYMELTKEELAGATPSQYSFNSGSFCNSFYKLCTLGIAIKTNGRIKLNPELLELGGLEE